MVEKKMKKCIHFLFPHFLFPILARRRCTYFAWFQEKRDLPVYPIEVFFTG